MMRANLFFTLPPSTALLLLFSLIGLPDPTLASYPIPWQSQPATQTVPHHALNVVAWPPLPTEAPPNPFADLRRRQDTNTICGFIGGNPGLPATCSPGSHCVLDADHNVIGCCPNGQSSCTAGVFTGCVDANSGPQTVVNPYVFTCTGANVCYKNVFDGGFSQFGCGTGSNLATTVLATATGITGTLDRPSLSVPFTESVTSLSTPTTLGTISSTSATGTSSSSSSSSSSITSSSVSLTTVTNDPPTALTPTPTSTSSTSNTATAAPTPPASSSSNNHTGAIVGGTISGIAVAAAVVAAVVYLMRRRARGGARAGPGQGAPNRPPRSTEYVSPMSGGAYFAPVHQTDGGYETGLAPYGSPYNTNYESGYSTGSHQSYPPPEGFHYPAQYQADYGAAAAAGMGGVRGTGSLGYPVAMEGDRIPLTQEIDDFSRGFRDALERIGEEDEEQSGGSSNDLPVNEGNGVNGGNGAAQHEYNGNMRPLWQQNRRQSRGLMWV